MIEDNSICILASQTTEGRRKCSKNRWEGKRLWIGLKDFFLFAASEVGIKTGEYAGMSLAAMSLGEWLSI